MSYFVSVLSLQLVLLYLLFSLQILSHDGFSSRFLQVWSWQVLLCLQSLSECQVSQVHHRRREPLLFGLQDVLWSLSGKPGQELGTQHGLRKLSVHSGVVVQRGETKTEVWHAKKMAGSNRSHKQLLPLYGGSDRSSQGKEDGCVRLPWSAVISSSGDALRGASSSQPSSGDHERWLHKFQQQNRRCLQRCLCCRWHPDYSAFP